MVIQHNMQAANARRMLGTVTSRQAKSAKKLSSGYRINSAADDAAGLTISEKMRFQIKGLKKASSNAQDGVSLIQVAEGALGEVHSILQRINELAVQAANDTNTTVDRDAIKQEINQLGVEIDRIAGTTQFNSMNLLDGSFQKKSLQVGALAGQGIQIDIKAMDTHALGLGASFDDLSMLDLMLQRDHSIEHIGANGDPTRTAYAGIISNNGTLGQKNYFNPKNCLMVNSYDTAIRTMQLSQNAVDLVSQMRSSLGAVQNRLEHTIANLDNTIENTTAAESRIRDTDMAKEMLEYSTNNILMQAGQAMLAQANQNRQNILSLLQ